MMPWKEVAKRKSKRYKELDVLEVLDLALPLIKGKERIVIPQFTKIKQDSWFDGLQKTAPRTLRQQ